MNKITLATLAQASAKEVLDQVSTHLLQQGKRAVNANDDCVYRTKEGLACAAGCLMTDEEAKSTYNANWSYLVELGVVSSAHKKMISSLQDIHDTVPSDEWAASLQHIREHLIRGVYEE